MTVTSIVVILAGLALPVARFALRRQTEMELRNRLRGITDAIDRYHELRVAGVIKGITLGSTTYPRSLDDLNSVELIDGRKIHLLNQRNLIDPFTGRKEWRTISSTDEHDATSSNGDDVFDVRSTSHALALDGRTHYDEW